MSTISSNRSAVRIVLTAAFLGVAGMVVGIGVALAGIVLLMVADVPVFDDLSLLITVSTVGSGLGFAIVAIGFLVYTDRDVGMLRIRFPTLSDVGWAVFGLIAMLAALIALNVVVTTLGIETADHSAIDLGIENPEIMLVLIVLSFLVIGPGEELLFRGVIQTYLVERLGLVLGIGIASVIFALVHLGAYQGEGIVTTIAGLFALSLILGAVYERTDNLVVPILIHGAFNAVQFYLVYLQATGELTVAFA